MQQSPVAGGTPRGGTSHLQVGLGEAGAAQRTRGPVQESTLDQSGQDGSEQVEPLRELWDLCRNGRGPGSENLQSWGQVKANEVGVLAVDSREVC